jgi:hypothetical protein
MANQFLQVSLTAANLLMGTTFRRSLSFSESVTGTLPFVYQVSQALPRSNVRRERPNEILRRDAGVGSRHGRKGCMALVHRRSAA